VLYPELKGNALAAYRDLVTKIENTAMTELALPKEEIVTRPMRPEDIGLVNPEWYFPNVAATAWTDIVSAKRIADSRFVGIYGVYNNEGASDACELRFTREGRVCRYWPIQFIRNFESNVGFADDPISIDQNTTITVSLWARNASTVTELALLGVVAEKRGLLTNP